MIRVPTATGPLTPGWADAWCLLSQRIQLGTSSQEETSL
jgi:hypothetical protein